MQTALITADMSTITSAVIVFMLLVFGAVANSSSKFYTKNGEPLYITGPKTYGDKIAIVGAGASGIDMATRLKKMGFTNIDIYEREDRIGGKSLTITDPQGTIQELGSCCMGPGYENNVIKIINEYAPPDSLAPRQFGSVWLDGLETPILYNNYVIKELMKYFETNDATGALIKLKGVIDKYSRKHKEMFGEYDFELMPRPSKEILQELDCSYMEFLQRNKFDGLRPLLLLTYTLQGYGYLDEIGAVYGLMWNTPYLLDSLFRLAIKENATRPTLLKSGFQNLWKAVAKKNNLNIHLKSRITKVKRTENGVDIIVHGQTKHYDFVIWSPEMKSSYALFYPAKGEEEKAFSSSNTDYLISSLVRLHGGARAKTPTSYWFDNLLKKRSSSVMASRNTKEAYRSSSTYASDKAMISEDNEEEQDIEDDNEREQKEAEDEEERYEIAFQYSRYMPCKPLQKAYAHFDRLGANVGINIQKVWRYFPHYSAKELTAGVLWDILEMQGKHKMWYIGSSVSFESLKSVVEYNKLLLSLMIPIKQ